MRNVTYLLPAKPICLVLGLGLILTANATALHAEPIKAPPADNSAITKAEEHNRSGVAYYQQGEFAKAIREMLMAFRLVNDSRLLFNIARIYHQMEEYGLAVKYYDKYILTSDADPNLVEKALGYKQDAKKSKTIIGSALPDAPKAPEPEPAAPVVAQSAPVAPVVVVLPTNQPTVEKVVAPTPESEPLSSLPNFSARVGSTIGFSGWPSTGFTELGIKVHSWDRTSLWVNGRFGINTAWQLGAQAEASSDTSPLTLETGASVSARHLLSGGSTWIPHVSGGVGYSSLFNMNNEKTAWFQLPFAWLGGGLLHESGSLIHAFEVALNAGSGMQMNGFCASGLAADESNSDSPCGYTHEEQRYLKVDYTDESGLYLGLSLSYLVFF